jgi:hypothetical protein
MSSTFLILEAYPGCGGEETPTSRTAPCGQKGGPVWPQPAVAGGVFLILFNKYYFIRPNSK